VTHLEYQLHIVLDLRWRLDPIIPGTELRRDEADGFPVRLEDDVWLIFSVRGLGQPILGSLEFMP
jgi:hypothetical protein